MITGSVHLVGAGPGDPDLITVKALGLIKAADVLLYDRLVSEDLLSCAKEDALLIYCGKMPGAHSMSQERIQEEMARYALRGKRVVRLKGGDPLIFGRGGEEALALAEKGIPYEIVPGVTSALGAAAAGGIPLTHRDMSASVAFVTGSRSDGAASAVRWDLLAQGADTLVIYMGIGRIREIREQLIVHGRSEDTPAAIVERGSTESQRVLVGTLGSLERLAEIEKARNPSLIIIGETVKIRDRLAALARNASELAG
jgi:uroporphyrin-III C-methyltransferase